MLFRAEVSLIGSAPSRLLEQRRNNVLQHLPSEVGIGCYECKATIAKLSTNGSSGSASGRPVGHVVGPTVNEPATLIVPDRFRWSRVTGIRPQQRECGIVAKPRSPRASQDTKRARRANLAWVPDKEVLRRSR